MLDYRLRKIYRKLDAISRIVNCSGCIECERTTVYILPQEVDFFIEKGMPITKINNAFFIRKENKFCPMLDVNRKKCTIYDDRPFCCRLFPLDVFSRNGSVQWVFYNYCPEKLVKCNNKLSLKCLIREIEKLIPDDILKSIIDEDRNCISLEFLDQYCKKYDVIGSYNNEKISKNMFSTKVTGYTHKKEIDRASRGPRGEKIESERCIYPT